MKTGEKIKKRRQELGITAERLAEHVGVSKATISRYENASIKKIPYMNLLHIAYALNTTVRDLAGEELEPADETGELMKMIDQMEELQKRLIVSISELSPEKAALVEAFVQGIQASGPKE